MPCLVTAPPAPLPPWGTLDGREIASLSATADAGKLTSTAASITVAAKKNRPATNRMAPA
jgi:hypothetical protein